MARYVQRIALLGKERWIGWEIDGVGTEIPGLTLADQLSDVELRARGVKDFRPMSFENFLGMGATVSGAQVAQELHDQDLDFRLDALQVGMERYRTQGVTALPRSILTEIFGGDPQLDDPRVQERFHRWQKAGAVELVGRDDCYIRITGRLA